MLPKPVEDRRTAAIFRAGNRQAVFPALSILISASFVIKAHRRCFFLAKRNADRERRLKAASVRPKFSASARAFFQWAYATLACSVHQLEICACFFLLPFVRWFGIPSPFAAALLLGLNRPPELFSLLGMALSLALRLLWGIESDPWQYAGLLFLWLLLRRSRPRPGIETAALGGAP